MSPQAAGILLALLLSCCSEDPKAEQPHGAAVPIPPPTGQQQQQPPRTINSATPTSEPPARKPNFDAKLQHLQEQVDWVNRRIGTQP